MKQIRLDPTLAVLVAEKIKEHLADIPVNEVYEVMISTEGEDGPQGSADVRIMTLANLNV